MSSIVMALPRQYRYQYRLVLLFDRWVHNYELIGKHGGVHLHITDHGENFAYGPRYSSGLEFHARHPVNSHDGPPDHDRCWLLNCPCWHDGTSMWAQEKYVPMFDGRDHELVFRALAGDADRYFEKDAAG